MMESSYSRLDSSNSSYEDDVVDCSERHTCKGWQRTDARMAQSVLIHVFLSFLWKYCAYVLFLSAIFVSNVVTSELFWVLYILAGILFGFFNVEMFGSGIVRFARYGKLVLIRCPALRLCSRWNCYDNKIGLVNCLIWTFLKTNTCLYQCDICIVFPNYPSRHIRCILVDILAFSNFIF